MTFSDFMVGSPFAAPLFRASETARAWARPHIIISSSSSSSIIIISSSSSSIVVVVIIIMISMVIMIIMIIMIIVCICITVINAITVITARAAQPGHGSRRWADGAAAMAGVDPEKKISRQASPA